MISFTDKNRLINRFITRAKDTLLQEGAYYPTLALYSKGSPIEILEGTEDIPDSLLVQNTLNKSVSDDFIAEDGQLIYVSFVVFSFEKDETIESINRAAEMLVEKYKPDMTCFVIPVLFSAKSDGTPVELNPESVRALHGVYYTKQVKDNGAILINYVNRGELAEDLKEIDPLGDSVNYDITFVESAWVPVSKYPVKPVLSDPFKRN